METIEKMAEDTFALVKGYWSKMSAPILARLDALEKRAPEKGDRGENGIDGKDGQSIKGERGDDGRSVDPGEVIEAARKAVEALPKPKDGSAGLDGKDGAAGVDGKDGLHGKAGEKGLDGTNGTNGIDGKNGADGLNGKDGSAGIDGKNGADGLNGKDGSAGIDGKDGAAGLNGKDGAAGLNGKDADPDVVKALVASLLPGMVEKAAVMLAERIDESLKEARAELAERIVEMVKAIPPAPAGKDADPEVILRMFKDAVGLVPAPKDGAAGRDAPTIDELREVIKGEVAIAAKDIPPGRDGRDAAGKDGKNGVDGLSIDDMQVSMKGDRTIELSFTRSDGEVIRREIHLKGLPVYKGVYRKGAYEDGDAITFGGSTWVAKRDTDTAPPSDDWQMAVKGTR